jgi:hypothetical protein
LAIFTSFYLTEARAPPPKWKLALEFSLLAAAARIACSGLVVATSTYAILPDQAPPRCEYAPVTLEMPFGLCLRAVRP